jgi:hypothetical protein
MKLHIGGLVEGIGLGGISTSVETTVAGSGSGAGGIGFGDQTICVVMRGSGGATSSAGITSAGVTLGGEDFVSLGPGRGGGTISTLLGPA